MQVTDQQSRQLRRDVFIGHEEMIQYQGIVSRVRSVRFYRFRTRRKGSPKVKPT